MRRRMREAKERAEGLGHTLDWQVIGSQHAEAVCPICGLSAKVELTRGISRIKGEALEEPCRAATKRGHGNEPQGGSPQRPN